MLRLRDGAWASAVPFSLALAALGGIGWAERDLFERLMREDGLVEWATFFAFSAAAVLAAHGAARGEDLGLLDRFVLGLLALFCLFVAGEEISWGQRALGFAPPDYFLRRNYQQELNFHNLLRGYFDSRWQVFVVAVGYGVLAPTLAAIEALPAALAPRLALIPWAGAVALIELVYPFPLAGELAELLLGMYFVADVAARRADRHEPEASRVAAIAHGAALVAAAMVGPAVAFAQQRLTGDRAGRARGELTALRWDVAADGVVTSQTWDKKRVHKRLFVAVRQRYLRVGERAAFLEYERSVAEGGPRRDRRGYFLDPWDQPYWFAFERDPDGRARALVYSFGANRRRDTDLGRLPRPGAPARMTGDDLGVAFELRRRAAARR